MNKRQAIDWFKRAAEKNKSAVAELVELGSEEPEAMYILGQLYEAGKGVDKSVENALMWYRKALSKGHAMAAIALGRMCENRPLAPFTRGSDVLACYEEALGFYKFHEKALEATTSEDVQRVTLTLDTLSKLKEPDFRNFGFVKLKAELADAGIELTPDVLYWFAYLCGLSMRSSENVQGMIGHALRELARFPKMSKQLRADFKCYDPTYRHRSFCSGTLV